MIEYYREALFEAIVFCISKGFLEDYLLTLDVYGFGEVYKYLKRIDARESIKLTNITRAAMGATKKEYTKFINMLELWLPFQETSNSTKNNAEAFKDKVKKGF